MPSLPFQFITLLADFTILIFVVYYFFKLSAKEKELDKKEGKIDTQYHQVVDNALTRERKILEDATSEAEHIIQDAKYVSSSSKDIVDQALQKMIDEIHKETVESAHQFMISYSSSLKELSTQSQKDFQSVSGELQEGLKVQVRDFQDSAKQLELDLKKQIQDFHDTVLPGLEKELDEYKKVRIKQAEQTITTIVQKSSQEILNKSISVEDHQKLIIDSLEKAKKEGIFN